REAKSFAMGVLLREERKAAGLTQAQLAERVGKKREFISRIERDGSNITLTTLFEIAEKGLGKKITIQMH
ncbi:MAG: helix-turn-helix domain-containing protein, partial [Cytophagales bacterium]|nr:helix-turn-helix domain-containing protein [Cytophagales bacterium]